MPAGVAKKHRVKAVKNVLASKLAKIVKMEKMLAGMTDSLDPDARARQLVPTSCLRDLPYASDNEREMCRKEFGAEPMRLPVFASLVGELAVAGKLSNAATFLRKGKAYCAPP